jgi:hypothetical protein
MAGAGGFSALILPLAAPPSNLAPLLGTGQSIAGIVALDANQQAFVRLAGTRLPLPESSLLAAGTRVWVRLTREAGEPRLLVEAVPMPVTASTKPDLSAVGPWPRLLPPALLQSPAAQGLVRALLSGGVPLETLLGRLRETLVRAGQREAAPVPASIHGDDSAETIVQWLRQWVRTQRVSPESVLARAESESIPRELPLDDAVLRRAVSELPVSARNSAEKFFDRLTGARLWNLHGSEQAYAFAELPVQPESFWKRARLHVFDEPESDRWDFRGPVQVVLEVDTLPLGRLVVTLRLSPGGPCSCRVEAELAHTRERFESATPELRAALGRAGFADAHIDVAPLEAGQAGLPAGAAARLAGLDLDA